MSKSAPPSLDRRQLLAGTAGVVAAGTTLASTLAAQEKRSSEGKRLKHSIVHWCFKKYWNVEQTCEIAKKLGCSSVEIVPPEDWPTLKKYGLVCAMAPNGMPGAPFEKGFNNPRYHEQVITSTKKAIDACAEFGFPNVIAFTGFREDIPDDMGIKNCVTGFKKIVGHAERQKVTICLEMLNSRVNEEMKGHPGYQGDHTDYCIEVLKQVGSPRLKLLFDIYHVQIMDGDVIVRIRQFKDWIAHIHTAGNPGRCELDAKQEINYPPIAKALADVGYTGHVGHEFIPTRDPLQGLKEAVVACDF
jgi:hydroxypyruvate isomerase